MPAVARRFLFLQGPPGPFFATLAGELRAAGHGVCRVNFHGGDALDWAESGALDYRGRASAWPAWVATLMRRRGITDLVLFGDCRPPHMAARHAARQIGIRIHVFEEGYIRPNWLTLEEGGVNGHSALPRDAGGMLAAARGLPPLARLDPPGQMPVTATPGRRLRDTFRYYGAMVAMAPLWPLYRSHRPDSALAEAVGWTIKYVTRRRRISAAQAAIAALARHRYFLFPLQLSTDYQIRAHSPFAAMRPAVDAVLDNFAAHAPAEVLLVIKAHPLDTAWRGWGAYVRAQARRRGLDGRVLHIDGGDLCALAQGARGMVVVNSTSATFALAAGVPVMALGTAVYGMAGLVHQGPLATFWAAPQAPDPLVYDAFCRVLHHRCLVRGGLASGTALAMLVANALTRLLAPGPASHSGGRRRLALVS